MAEYSPSVRMRNIAKVLQAWRERSGWKNDLVANKCGWSTAKQSRLENAKSPITPADVMTIALTFKDFVTEDERVALFERTQAAQDPRWWETVADGALVTDMLDYVELESECSRMRTFKIDLIDGLLQTPEYAAAISRAYVPRASEDLLRDRVDARIKRQKRLTEEDPIRLEAVLTEGALRLTIDESGSVMRAQLAHLLDAMKLPNVDIRVIATADGPYPAMGTPFSLLSFGNDDPDVGYVELVDRGVYVEEPDWVGACNLAFDATWDLARSTADSAELIASLIDTA